MKPDDLTPQAASAESDVLSPEIVSQCATLNEAQMVVSLLASFGIQAAIEAENYHRMLGSIAHGPNGIRVQVRQVDAGAAREILEQSPEESDLEF